MKTPSQVAQVLVDVPGLPALDYAVPEDMDVAIGDRVSVTVVTRAMVGIVVGLSDTSDVPLNKLKKLRSVFRDMPPLGADWLALTRFAATYYIRRWGEVALSALPTFMKRNPTPTQAKRFVALRELPKAKPLPYEAPPTLNDEQAQALARITQAQGFEPFLLFGVTGSGKTEVYLHAIESVLEKDPDAQVLLLVPEINLTPQLENRVRARFPNETVVSMHSELADGARAKAWLAVHEGRARVLIGTRLAVFASVKKLGLVIVDEEHDPSFKAGDGSRFSARDLAVWRAKHAQVPVILGSATPSLETWAQQKEGRYTCLTLGGRAVAKATLPSLELVPPPGPYDEAILTPYVVEQMEAVLSQGRQVLVFLNRRGYASSVSCPACEWVSTCEHCSTFTVFHKAEGRLICHHCGTSKRLPPACPSCGNVDILPRGHGTERLEETLATLFPGKTVLRIDRDRIQGKRQADAAFKKVHQGEVDILVGTQMIAKGHDFKHVGLVVILNADAQLMSPDLRAREHLFATLVQVAGRAGRHGEKGRVLVQTRYPEDGFFRALERQDYPAFADPLLAERHDNYAVPYVHQALLTCRAKGLQDALFFLKNAQREGFALMGDTVRVYDPVPMSILKLHDEERAQLLVEADSRVDLNRFLWAWTQTFPRCGDQAYSLEVDPASV